MKNIFFTLIGCIMISCISSNKISYNIIGTYNYQITDTVKFKKTYLTLGYVIGDLQLDKYGINIYDLDSIQNRDDDFIITLNYPIKEVLTDSDNISNEGIGETTKKAVEIILNKEVKTNKVYIYRLEEKGKYRLLAG
jgi:hypothetical protein